MCRPLICSLHTVIKASGPKRHTHSVSNNDGDSYYKTSLKKSIPAASNFIALIPSRLILQMLAIFLELNSKGPCQSSRREKEICCPVFPSSTKTKAKNSVQKKKKA